MTQLLIFAGLLFFVSQSSIRINKLFFQLNHRFTPRFNLVLYMYSLILLPGTILHELSHLLMAAILLVKTGSMNFIPKYQKDYGLTLGTAQIAKTDFIRLSLIGLAPTLIGIIAIYFITQFGLDLKTVTTALQNSLNNQNTNLTLNWNHTLTAYLLFAVGNTMHTSKSDRQAWPLLLVFLVAIFLANYFVKFVDISFFSQIIPAQFFYTINSALVMVLGVNLATLILISLIQKTLHLVYTPMLKFSR